MYREETTMRVKVSLLQSNPAYLLKIVQVYAEALSEDELNLDEQMRAKINAYCMGNKTGAPKD